MITIYSLDPARNLISHVQTDLARRTVEIVTPGEPAFAIGEFARHAPGPGSRRPDPAIGYEQGAGGSGHQAEATAGSLMSHPLITAPSTETAGFGLDVMERHAIHHLAVIHDGSIAGLALRSDLLAATAHQNLLPLAKPYLVALSSIPVSAIALIFLTGDWTACLVRTPEGMTGILTTRDLLKALLPPLPDASA